MFVLDGTSIRQGAGDKKDGKTKIMPKISFIIASVDRDRQLEECISSIEKAHEYNQDIPIEILVIIQKAEQKKDIRIRYPEIIRFHYIDRIGLSTARNFAIGKSAGEYLVFLDDDAGIKEDFINVLSEKIAIYNNAGAFCGKLIDPVRNIPFSTLFADGKNKKLERFDYQYFMGSAHILTRRVIEKVGCYDERFGVGARYRGSEETDMFFRLKAAGEQIVYLPDLVFFHPVLFPPPKYIRNYSYAVGAMLTKNCIYDKTHFFTYWCIVFGMAVKASVRIFQKLLLKGVYKEKDERYHYSSVLKGLLFGVKDYLAENAMMKGNVSQ